MPYITVEVDVDMDSFSDEDIREEYEARGLGNESTSVSEREEQLRRAHMLHHAGKKEQAYEILWQLCLDDLNKVL